MAPEFSEEILQSLTVMFPTILNSALHILDFGKVTRFVCRESRREFFRVQESQVQSAAEEHSAKPANERTASGAVYYDLVGDFCCCFFYTQQCLVSKEAMTCKHVLAARLAEALSESHEDKLHVKEIPDVDFAPLILSSKNHSSFKDRKSAHAF